MTHAAMCGTLQHPSDFLNQLLNARAQKQWQGLINCNSPAGEAPVGDDAAACRVHPGCMSQIAISSSP